MEVTVFLSFLVVSSIVVGSLSQASHCDLCAGGENITLPYKQIQLPGFEFIENCKMLAELSPVLLLAESEECQLLQSIGTICGCAKAHDACELCPNGSSLTYATRKLEFLAPTFGGVIPTCEMVEAGLHAFPQTDSYCLGSIQLFSEFCGCGAQFVLPPAIAENRKCYLCQGTNDDVIREKELNIDGIPFETCGQLADAALSLFERRDVASFEDLEDNNCFLIRSLSVYCGCRSDHFAPCHLCAEDDTNRVPFPDSLVNSSFTSLFFNGIDLQPTCEVLADVAQTWSSRLEEHETLCKMFQGVGVEACGCTPPSKPSCSMCSTPIPEENLDSTFIVAPPYDHLSCRLLSTALIYVEDGDLVPSGRPSEFLEFDCTVWQTAGYLCGCNDGLFTYWGADTLSKQRTAVWLQRTSGILSMCGSFAIVLDIAMRRRWKQFKSQIMVSLSLFDLLSSIGWFVGPLANDQGFIENFVGIDTSIVDVDVKDQSFYGSRGNELTCKLQGFVLHLGFTSILYNMSLAYFYKLSVINGKRDDQFSFRHRLIVLSIPAIVGFCIAIITIQFIVPTPVGCTFGTHNTSGGWVKVVLLFYLPYGPAFIFIPMTTLFIYCRVYQVYVIGGDQNADVSDSSNSKLSNLSNFVRKFLLVGSNNRNQELQSKLFHEAFWYVAAFFASYSIFIVIFALDGLEVDAYWLLIAASILTPLQGFFNSLNYFRKRLASGMPFQAIRVAADRCLSSIEAVMLSSGPSAAQAMQHDQAVSIPGTTNQVASHNTDDSRSARFFRNATEAECKEEEKAEEVQVPNGLSTNNNSDDLAPEWIRNRALQHGQMKEEVHSITSDEKNASVKQPDIEINDKKAQRNVREEDDSLVEDDEHTKELLRLFYFS